MCEDIFKNVSDIHLKDLYEQILVGKEDGLRPRCLDEYIRIVQKIYPMDFGEAWRCAENLFWYEVARRFFERME